jgi:hypothetical protein
LRPAQELVSFAIPLVFEIDILGECQGGTEPVDLHGVVDDQISRHQRVDPGDVATEFGHRIPHRGQIDDSRDPCEILEYYASRQERQLHALPFPGWSRFPSCKRLHRLGVDKLASGVAKCVLQKDAHGERQGVEVCQPLFFERLEPVIGNGFTKWRRKARPRAERVWCSWQRCGVHSVVVLFANSGQDRAAHTR